MGRKNWSDKDTKVRGKGAQHKRQQGVASDLAKVTKKKAHFDNKKNKAKKAQAAKRVFEEPPPEKKPVEEKKALFDDEVFLNFDFFEIRKS